MLRIFNASIVDMAVPNNIHLCFNIYVLKESEMLWKWRKEEKTYIAV